MAGTRSAGRLTRRARVWYGAFYVDGIRYIRSTRCTDKRAAETILTQWERDAADPDSATQNQATLNDALELLIRERSSQAVAGKRSKETVAFYRKKAGVLLFHLGRDRRLRGIDARVVDEYIEKRRFDGASENTISKELTTLRGALKLCKRRKLWTGDLHEVMPAGFSAEYRPRERYLTVEELQKLLPQLLPEKAAVVAFIIATAADWSAVGRALRADVAIDGTRCTIRGSKTSTGATASCRSPPTSSGRSFATPLSMPTGKGGGFSSPWLNVRRDLRIACARAGIPPVSPNDLRRTFGTWLRQQGVVPSLIAPAMGHADSRMVERVYGRLPIEDLRAQLAAAASVPLLPICSAFEPSRVRRGVYHRCIKRGHNRWIRWTRWTSRPRFSPRNRAQGRNRTADTGIFSPLLYRLSYLRDTTPVRLPRGGARGDGRKGAETGAEGAGLSSARCRGQSRETGPRPGA